MCLAGCQIIPIDLNFQLQICLEIFDKNSADKNLIKKDKGWKVLSLMSISLNVLMKSSIKYFNVKNRQG